MSVFGSEHLTAVLVRALLAWLERGIKPQAEPAPDGGYLLRHGRRYRVAAVVIAVPYPLFCLFGALASVFGGAIPGGLLIAYETVFGVVGIVAVLWGVAVYRRSVLVNDAGFELRRAFLGRVAVAWQDIEAVRYSARLKVLKLYEKRGECCWLSTGFDGLGTFRAYLACHAPGVADTAARAAMPKAIPPAALIPHRRAGFALSSAIAWKRQR
jgi:hypothetical protein